MTSFPRRMLRAALLHADTYEEVEADKRSKIDVYDSYLAPDLATGDRVTLEANVDRDSVSRPREREFHRLSSEREALGEVFQDYWRRADPQRRGAQLGRDEGA